MIDRPHVSLAHLQVYYSEKYNTILNKRFIDQQDAWNNLEDIKAAFYTKYMLFDLIDNCTDSAMLKEYAKDLQALEFCIQGLFNFDEDARFHRFWEVPKCSCPKMDNADAWGTDYSIVDKNCVLHGD